MSSGWIMLHRKLTDWEWYDDINTSRLFIHLLLTANHKDNNWRGINIKRGSRLTSLDKISKETNLSVSKIRTSVKKLILTRELASKSHAQHTVFTVINYDEYQGDDKLHDKPVTNQSQSNDKALATNNNVKNDNNDNKLKDKASDSVNEIDFSILNASNEHIAELKRVRAKNNTGKSKVFSQRMVDDLAKQIEAAKSTGWTIDAIITEWEVRGWKSFKAEWLKQNSFTKPSKHDLSQMNYQSGKL